MNGDDFTLPSVVDVLKGLKEFFDDIIDEKYGAIKSQEDIDAYKNQQHMIFDRLVLMIQLYP